MFSFPRNKRKTNYKQSSSDLNLIPIMNLVLVLIPAVLYQTQLVKIGVVEMNTPKIGCCRHPYPSEQALGLKISLDHNQGFILKTMAEPIGKLTQALVLNSSPGQKNKDSLYLIPKKTNGHFDFKRLYEVTAHLKKQYPQSSSVTLTGTAQIEFKYFIYTMDTIRYFNHQDHRENSIDRREMWNRVQFAMVQKS